MQEIKASQDLRPMSDLKSHGADIVRQTQETRRPIVLTKHGKGVAVVMALEDYEELRDVIEHLELVRGVREAEDQIDRGEVIPHEQVMAKLRRRAAGHG